MIDLYQFGPVWELSSASPFCTKIELFLKMAKLNYNNHLTDNTKKAPLGKLPYIVDNGTVIADSSLITSHLISTHTLSIDQHLSKEQYATSIALQRMLEEHLYWGMVYSRWFEPTNWPITKKAFFGKLPTVLKSTLPGIIRSKMKKSLELQGLGKHTIGNLYQLCNQDIEAIIPLMSKECYFFGNKPSSFDTCLFAFIDHILNSPIESPLKEQMKKYSQFNHYCERIKREFFYKEYATL